MYNIHIGDYRKKVFIVGIAPEHKPLLPKQREFIHLIVYQGLSRNEAYSKAYNVPFEETDALKNKAARIFYKPNVISYYNALMEEVRDTDIKKAVWTKELATEKLVRLIERAEHDLYEENEKLTMGKLNAIVLPVKELNLMNGYNLTNVNAEGCIVQITGEESIPD